MTELEEGRVHERVDTNSRDIGKLWSAHRELAVVVRGENGDNGLRSDVRALEEWRATHMTESIELRKNITHYRDVERLKTCHGIKALDDHIEQHLKMLEESSKTKESRMRHFLQGWGQILQFIGIIIVALITASRI